MQSQFSAAIAQICEEKNINRDTVIQAIEAAIGAAYRKDYGNINQKVRVEFDEKTGFIRVFQQHTVVEEIENEDAEYTLAQAKKIKKSAQIGDVLEKEVVSEGFGRIAAQTAKQVIIQRIREAEKEAIYNIYKDREGDLLAGQIQRVEADGTVFLDLDRATVMMEKAQTIPHESFYNGQRIKVLLEKVDRNDKGPQIIISRNHPEMIRKLLELEVPEVTEGTVVIKGIAREAGIRTKISVTSGEEGVDPVGSCVGQKGVRIQAVTDELSGERIDIVEWAEAPVQYLINALAPAKIISIKLDEKKKLAKVYVTEDQRSLAIGKNGQNVRLASILTDWEIDIEDYIVEGKEEAEVKTGDENATVGSIRDLPETQPTENAQPQAKTEVPGTDETTNDIESEVDLVREPDNEETASEEIPATPKLSDLKGITKTTISKLKKAGIETLEDLQAKSQNELAKIEGLDNDSATKIIELITPQNEEESVE